MKNKKVLIIVFIIIDVLVLGFVGYNLLFGDLGKKYTLNIYKNKEENYFCHNSNVVNAKCSDLGFTIETETKNPETLSFDINYNYMLYKDNGIKLYNIKNKHIDKIDLEDNYDNYNLISNDKKQLMGIIYQLRKSDSNYYESYYNLITNKKMYVNKYNAISSKILDDKYLEATIYTKDNEQGKSFLLNINSEKEELSIPIKENGMISFEIKKYNNKNLYVGTEYAPKGNYITICSNKKETLVTGLNSNFDYSIYNGILYVNDNNVIKKFDFDGNLLESKDLKSGEQIIHNYVIYKDKNILKMYNIDTKEDIKITELKDDNYISNDYDTQVQTLPLTSYYTKEDLKTLDEVTSANLTEEGIYIVIGFKEKDSKGNSGLIYYFDEENKAFKTYNIDKK